MNSVYLLARLFDLALTFLNIAARKPDNRRFAPQVVNFRVLFPKIYYKKTSSFLFQVSTGKENSLVSNLTLSK